MTRHDDAKKVRDRIHGKAGEARSSLQTARAWIEWARRNPHEVPRPQAPDLQPGKPTPVSPHVTGGWTSDRTGDQAVDAVKVVHGVITQTHRTLTRLASDRYNRCGGHPPARDLDPVSNPADLYAMFATARSDVDALVERADAEYAPQAGESGMTSTELSWYFFAPLDDVAGDLYGMIRHWAMKAAPDDRPRCTQCHRLVTKYRRLGVCNAHYQRQLREAS